MRIELQYPITVEGEQVRVLEIARRPTVRDLKATDQARGDVGKVAALLGELCALPPSSVDQIDAADFAVIADQLAPFFGSRPATGETSSATSPLPSAGPPAS